VCPLLVLALCAGCAGPFVDWTAYRGECLCGEHCDIGIGGCKSYRRNQAACWPPSVQATWNAMYEICAPCVPCPSPANCSAGEPFRPGRFHPVPTRPVFGGYQSFH
jgi:hypothetical protein